MMGAGTFQPPLWALVGVAVPSILVGLWAMWDALQAPRVPLAARVAIAVSLVSLIQWTVFLGFRAGGLWDATTYEQIAAPYRLLVLSPVGGWGIWFTMHWFARRNIRRANTTRASCTTGSGDRLGD